MNNINNISQYDDELNTDSTFVKIFEIFKNNGVDENEEDAALSDDSFADFIFGSIKKLSRNEITDDMFISSAQDKIKISEEVAKNILKDIKENGLITTSKIKIKEIKKSAPKKQKEAPIKNTVISKRSGPDEYREPIE